MQPESPPPSRQRRRSPRPLWAAAVAVLLIAGEPDPRYVMVTMARLQLPAVNRRIADLKSKLQRLNPVEHVDEHLRLFGELVPLEQHARALRDQAVAGW